VQRERGDQQGHGRDEAPARVVAGCGSHVASRREKPGEDMGKSLIGGLYKYKLIRGPVSTFPAAVVQPCEHGIRAAPGRVGRAFPLLLCGGSSLDRGVPW
jgi:hypothetical protein